LDQHSHHQKEGNEVMLVLRLYSFKHCSIKLHVPYRGWQHQDIRAWLGCISVADILRNFWIPVV